MKKYLLGRSAEVDLDCIWEYIAQDNIHAADRWIAKLFDSFQTITNTPGIGHDRQDLTTLDVKFWSVGSYLILYRIRNELVEIIAVTHGARDIPEFLRQRTQNQQSK
jgi:toxin ParE1/3/4